MPHRDDQPDSNEPSTNARVSEVTELSKIKTGSFERRLSLTKAGLVAGSRLAGSIGLSLFGSKESRQNRRARALSDQAEYLVKELGKLKGSVVKIGQVMALYGEHFLPDEVTRALHTLEENTVALEWPVIRGVLFQELGQQRMAELDVEESPLGTASLGQVHRATVRKTGEKICLKVQYPGVSEAVDTDLNDVANLLKITRIVTAGPVFDDWLEEVRVMMHREVNYRLEAETTDRFNELVKNDPRYVVPKVLFDYSSARVLATSFEEGEHISSDKVSHLPLPRRNFLAKASLELFLNELFIWHEIQTDPNFGNYRIRLRPDHEHDQIVLLDFGAVQKYPQAFIDPVCSMIEAAYLSDMESMIDGGIRLQFMKPDWPQKVLDDFAAICIAVLEPLSEDVENNPDAKLNEDGQYCWSESDLPTRIAKRAAVSAISRYFKVPPKEFVFLNRKLVGVYTFISVLKAEFNGRELLQRYLSSS